MTACHQIPTCNITEEHDHCWTWRDGVQDDGSGQGEPLPTVDHPKPAPTLTGGDWGTIERALFTYRREAQAALARLAKSPGKTRATTYARERWQRQLDEANTALNNLRVPCEVCGSIANDESGDRLHFAEDCFK